MGYREVRLSLLALLAAIALITGCTSANGPSTEQSQASDQSPTSVEPTATTGSQAASERDTIVVPLSLHVMVEQGNPTSDLSSRRTPEGLATIASAMGEIWDQADVVFDPITTQVVEVPATVLESILLGNTDAFFDQVNVTFAVENSQAINGFYVRGAFGVNGFTPQGSNLFFVVDKPSVHDERVSSHEVGHIFGLRHDLEAPTQLMFSGTNGTVLSELEQTVARYSVQGLFPQGVDP